MSVLTSSNRETNKKRLTHKLYRGWSGQYLSRFIFLGILALIVWLPLPMGSNRPWALAVIELSVACLLFIWVLGFISGKILVPKMSRTHFYMLTLWGLWLCWLYFQSLTLPIVWVEALSPNTLSIYGALADLSGRATTEVLPISLKPGATLSHFYESLAYAGLFWLVVLVCGVRHRLRSLLWVLVLSGIAQAIYGSLMTITGLELGFLHSKDFYRGSATGTFINRNHFAGYLEITLAAAFGLLVATSHRFYGKGWRAKALQAIDTVLSPSVLIRVSVIVLFAALVLSRSRMGNIAFLSALILCAGLYLLSNWRRDWWRVLLLMLGFVIVDLWWVGGWFGGDALIERFESTRLETELRAKMLPDLLRMIWLWPVTGSGMGSFHVIYPHFQGAEVTGFNLHAHNDYAQFLIELGIPGALLILSLAGISVIRAVVILVRRKDPLALGIAFAALLATMALAIHSVADFNLQIPANAGSLVIVLAAVWCCDVNSAKSRTRK